MTSALSKRQQARNERALQELITTVPGNERCVDCQARNPGWASWNLGVFLCMRCAALHRKLGTHISKVKSLSMDSWSSDQVDNMRKNGNLVVNKIYNPRNVKPPIPIDVDEADSAMERFIRQKYESKVLEDGRPKPPSRHDPSYTSMKARVESPPPLPPKTGRRFGFGLRSAPFYSTSAHSEQISPQVDYTFSSNRQSRSFGASVVDRGGTFESKLEALRELGFPDNKRNATILKGMNGDMDKTIESLVRLGEGVDPRSRTRVPVPKSTSTSSQFSEPTKSPKSAVSTNPFDNLDSAPSLARSSYAGSQAEPQRHNANGGTSYNPFDSLSQPAPSQSTLSLDQSFQQLQVSQPLFPNTTGGYPSQQGQLPLQRYQQSMTPPVTMLPQNVLTASPMPMNGNYNPFFQNDQVPQQNTTNNSYLGQSQSLSPTNPFFSTAGQIQVPQSQIPASAYSPGNSNQTEMPQFQRFNTMPILPLRSQFSQQQQQPQQQQPVSPPQQPQQPQQQFIQQDHQGPYNPFATSAAAPMPSYQPQFTPGTQQFPIPQQTGKIDKTSILALYNFSQPPPTIPEQPLQQSTPDLTTSDPTQPQFQTQPPTGIPVQQQQNPSSLLNPSQSTDRNPYHIVPPNPITNGMATTSVPSMPLSQAVMGAKSQMGNAPAGGGGAGGGGGGGGGVGIARSGTGNPFPARSHMSQASVDIGGMHNGRHSPDVFASLTSRYVQ
ncbi:hypothetical protein GX48_02585 [Paracoccidioides brasiliensis]|nr:hypothetical protein GX48_02585 [Paracoccidioides brasiliensis]